MWINLGCGYLQPHLMAAFKLARNGTCFTLSSSDSTNDNKRTTINDQIISQPFLLLDSLRILATDWLNSPVFKVNIFINKSKSLSLTSIKFHRWNDTFDYYVLQYNNHGDSSPFPSGYIAEINRFAFGFSSF